MRLLAIGRGKPGPEAELFARYAARIKPNMALQEFNDGVGAAVEIKRREAETLLAAIGPQDFVVALDAGGKTPDSLDLAKMLTGWTETAKKLTFVIGGAEGLDASVIARADAVLSLGRLTWPHMLVRPMLAEQIYRAQMIKSGHPYHRAGRP
ncbi:MAG: 23S rRNA (pseudouridine(1915)-N(3))-methyltransferase RlmH [Acidocella sp. 20-57-95]|nr:MAG: 23S rRNA (pseudouridine(1915)-N(3))-methyltransferase RlmH [Acidocella sp. 20-57-95]OYV62031.1 MAG: 23S rRNA (pseudouridine(1915)-N(3))-methyltransferase RlmH [Acidocella sp. 21-58-7]HQT65573.1 23S rRNA (pseudouridine(1915)-N(3))-methyltransferase RlmH [Acidocella sp.]HQU03460.1 23S rRNA (pseudouridine(1915)-N(3))-methyltransferase RlmH [Acidocella sp.]